MGLLTYDDFAFSGLGQGYVARARAWLKRGGRPAPRERPGEARARRTRTRTRREISERKLRELDARAKDCAKRLAAAQRKLRDCNKRCRPKPKARGRVAEAGPSVPRPSYRIPTRRRTRTAVAPRPSIRPSYPVPTRSRQVSYRRQAPVRWPASREARAREALEWTSVASELAPVTVLAGWS